VSPSAPAERLGRSFFARPTLEVARALLGCRLHRRIDGQVLHGRIVEVEAYTTDAASHARDARRTPRNTVMFGPPGHAYVYFTYGMHFCFNVVTETEGVPGAVLLRGLDEIAGAHGPARLCRVLGIDLRHNGIDLTASDELCITAGCGGEVVTSTRIGIRVATDLPWRLHLAGSPGVSRPERRGRGNRQAR
jgi:DNA-3-methyladenine glycosylase